MHVIVPQQRKIRYTDHMFIQVKLLKGFNQPLLYKVPSEWAHELQLGSIVRVPIQNRITPAVVIEQLDAPPAGSTFTIKDAHSHEPFPNDPQYRPFIAQLGRYYQLSPIHFIKRVRQFLVEKEVKHRRMDQEEKKHAAQDVTLTEEQQAICTGIIPHIINPKFTPTLIHGVTGSGKTEIYKRLIQESIAQQKTALLLLPEVTLALQFAHIMKQQLSTDIRIFGFHSGSTGKEKTDLWKALLREEPILIIGVHLPILLPIAKLGIIIVDEEHDQGYQEKKHPKINTKEAAIWRAKLAEIPIVLGSATPSISSLHNAKTKGWLFFQLKKRFAGSFPTIKTVFLNDKKLRRNFWISQELENQIKACLKRKEQAIIFLNRRGYSFFVQCKACSFIFECKRCSVSLTLHEHNELTCHYCDYRTTLPQKCPTCSVAETEFLKKGIGTQQVVTILQKLLPAARIARADMDTTTKKNVWQQTMDDFQSGAIDILVGTQTITKGYHFPNVTLVGILWADLNLHFPMFNASETTLQQLIQVAGRAGRQRDSSMVIVQSMSDHRIFEYLNEVDYLQFYDAELETRQMVGYPPCKRLVEIELKHANVTLLEYEADRLIRELRQHQPADAKDIMILGPAKPPVHKIKNTHARKIYLKANNHNDLARLFQKIDTATYRSSLYFTPNPIN